MPNQKWIYKNYLRGYLKHWQHRLNNSKFIISLSYEDDRKLYILRENEQLPTLSYSESSKLIIESLTTFKLADLLEYTFTNIETLMSWDTSYLVINPDRVNYFCSIYKTLPKKLILDCREDYNLCPITLK